MKNRVNQELENHPNNRMEGPARWSRGTLDGGKKMNRIFQITVDFLQPQNKPGYLHRRGRVREKKRAGGEKRGTLRE